MKARMSRNKKGLSEFILDLLSYFTFVAALFIFFVVYTFYSKNQVSTQLKSISDISASNSNLISYLRTNVVVNGSEINIAELIRLWSVNPKKYNAILENASKGIINNWEHEYYEPQVKKNVLREYQLLISKDNAQGRSLNIILEVHTIGFDNSFCFRNEYGCINLGEQFIPVAEESGFYVILREGYISK